MARALGAGPQRRYPFRRRQHRSVVARVPVELSRAV